MDSSGALNCALERLVRELIARFGADVFRVRPTCGELEVDHVLIENLEDRRVSFTVGTIGQREGCYSVIVYFPRPEGEAGFGPCDHAVDRENVPFEELLEILPTTASMKPTRNRCAISWKITSAFIVGLK